MLAGMCYPFKISVINVIQHAPSIDGLADSLTIFMVTVRSDLKKIA